MSEPDFSINCIWLSRPRNHAFVGRLTQLDYSRAIAFIAIAKQTGEMLGAMPLHADANHENAEFAILVRSDLKGHGLGWLLMQLMLEYARAERLRTVTGQVLRENRTMLAMCRELGFSIEGHESFDGVLEVRLPLESG